MNFASAAGLSTLREYRTTSSSNNQAIVMVICDTQTLQGTCRSTASVLGKNNYDNCVGNKIILLCRPSPLYFLHKNVCNLQILTIYLYCVLTRNSKYNVGIRFNFMLIHMI